MQSSSSYKFATGAMSILSYREFDDGTNDKVAGVLDHLDVQNELEWFDACDFFFGRDVEPSVRNVCAEIRGRMSYAIHHGTSCCERMRAHATAEQCCACIVSKNVARCCRSLVLALTALPPEHEGSSEFFKVHVICQAAMAEYYVLRKDHIRIAFSDSLVSMLETCSGVIDGQLAECASIPAWRGAILVDIMEDPLTVNAAYIILRDCGFVTEPDIFMFDYFGTNVGDTSG